MWAEMGGLGSTAQRLIVDVKGILGMGLQGESILWCKQVMSLLLMTTKESQNTNLD